MAERKVITVVTTTTIVEEISSEKRSPTPCSFFAKGKCNKGNACKFLHDESTVEDNPTLEQKKRLNSNRLCPEWAYGACTRGRHCFLSHPPRTPKLQEVLQYKESVQLVPDLNNGIFTSTPDQLGLPPLPQNGKCRVMGNYIIYFIPFYIPFEGKYFFKKIRLFRFNPSKQCYKLVFSYRLEGFHITTAAASNGYLVCSRLPYDAGILKLMAVAKKLEKQNKRIQQSQSKLTEQVQNLEHKNRSLVATQVAQQTIIANQEDKIRKLKQSRVHTNPRSSYENRPRKPKTNPSYSFRSQATSERNVSTLQRNVFDGIRARDPVDIFVYHPERKTMVHVLEYHKPADHVHLDGNIMTLYDQVPGTSHIFELTMKTSNISAYDLSEPLRPSKLCDVF